MDPGALAASELRCRGGAVGCIRTHRVPLEQCCLGGDVRQVDRSRLEHSYVELPRHGCGEPVQAAVVLILGEVDVACGRVDHCCFVVEASEQGSNDALAGREWVALPDLAVGPVLFARQIGVPGRRASAAVASGAGQNRIGVDNGAAHIEPKCRRPAVPVAAFVIGDVDPTSVGAWKAGAAVGVGSPDEVGSRNGLSCSGEEATGEAIREAEAVCIGWPERSVSAVADDVNSTSDQRSIE